MNSEKVIILNIQIMEVPASLSTCVIQRIISYERKVAKQRAILQSFVSLLSIAGIVFVVNTLIDSFSQSGFYYYITLFFSRDGLVAWKEAGMSLAESLPVLLLAALLSAVVIFLWSGIKTASNVRVLISKNAVI